MVAEKRKKHHLTSSFKFAFQGIFSAVARERNMRIHVVISVIVILSGAAFSLNRYEWFAILFAIGGVLSLELMNTAIERTVDMFTQEFHPLAKQAKDIAAGAVLIYALVSVVVGIIIFLPKLLGLLIP